jgi:hypothetical protein
VLVEVLVGSAEVEAATFFLPLRSVIDCFELVASHALAVLQRVHDFPEGACVLGTAWVLINSDHHRDRCGASGSPQPRKSQSLSHSGLLYVFRVLCAHRSRARVLSYMLSSCETTPNPKPV